MKQRIAITLALSAVVTAVVAIAANGGIARTRSGRATPTSRAGTAAIRPSLWAVVDQNGHLIRGIGVVGATHTPGSSRRGDYVVTFSRRVRGCAWVATPRRLITAEGAAPEIFTWEGTQLNKVRVITAYPPPNTGTESGFSLVVVC